jgi:mannose-6-phosphate isomerase-like protein (cupin superfamily)
MKALSVFFIFATLLLFNSNSIFAQDAAKVAPDIVKVLLDNDKVRVLEFMVKPGESTGMHSHPNYVVYFLVDGKMQIILPDGKSSEMDVKAGDVRWSEAVTHNNKNIGKTESHAIVVELKTP